MNKNDGEKVIEMNKEIEKEKKESKKTIEKNKYSFVLQILKENVGNTVDEFLILNDSNRLNKHLSQGFTMFIIDAINKSEKQIIKKIEEILEQ